MAPSKRKITQDELRRLMNEQKKKCLSNNIKKIESPLAKYDKNGNLRCVVCETVVRSEAVWSVHLNSKTHKQNALSKIKKKEESFVPQSLPVDNTKPKRPNTPILIPQKNIKGILKNRYQSKISEKPIESCAKNQSVRLCAKSDSDDDDNSDNDVENSVVSTTNKEDTNDNDAVSEKNMQNERDLADVLPEGFFDDPKLDAKFRNVEYKDPIEEEWELFQKEIKEETNKAQQIIAEEQEEASAERQIDEIDEQIRNWSRVLDLEKKKERVNSKNGSPKNKVSEGESSEEDFEEFFDWRSKKSFEF